MATEAELTIQELGRLKRSTGAGDRNRLRRLRRSAVSEDGDTPEEEEESPGLWERIKRYWTAEEDSEADDARRELNDAITTALPRPLSASEAVKRKRSRLERLDRETGY